MSRSVKKTPGWTDHGKTTRWEKRQAAKAVRRTPDVPSGKAYRKCYETYNIHDYKFLFWSDAEIKRVIDTYYDGQIYVAYMK